MLWNISASNKGCINYVFTRSVNTQRGCQALCEGKSESECVGINYSHKTRYKHSCYLCKDDTLQTAYYEFGFYQRPGIFKICFLWSIERYFKLLVFDRLYITMSS